MAYEKSIMTDDLDHCYFCGRSPVQFHHVFGGSNRNKATEDGLFVPLCLNCHAKVHNDQSLNYRLKQAGQWAYKGDDFRERYGKNYL